MGLWSDLKSFREFIRTLHETTERDQAEIEQPLPEPPDEVVTYFIPYRFQYTEYHNGGRRQAGWGNTLMYIRNGVPEWAKIQAATGFIEALISGPPQTEFHNPQVIILGFFEVNRCIATQTDAKLEQQPEVPAPAATLPANPSAP